MHIVNGKFIKWHKSIVMQVFGYRPKEEWRITFLIPLLSWYLLSIILSFYHNTLIWLINAHFSDYIKYVITAWSVDTYAVFLIWLTVIVISNFWIMKALSPSVYYYLKLQINNFSWRFLRHSQLLCYLFRVLKILVYLKCSAFLQKFQWPGSFAQCLFLRTLWSGRTSC